MQTYQERLADGIGSGRALNVLAEAGAVETLGLPVRADLLLADRVLFMPDDARRATMAAVAGSVVAGGLLYVVGALLGVMGGLEWLSTFGSPAVWAGIQTGMVNYAPLLVLAAGVATAPFAVLLLLAGFMGVAPFWLFPAALLARSVRYGLMAWLLWRGGSRYRDWLNRYYHGLTLVVALGLLLAAVFLLLLKYL